MIEKDLPCRAKGCDGKRSATELLCRTCWYRVPKPLRDEIWRLFRAAPGTPTHLRAVHEAIRIAEEKLAA